MQKGKCKFFNGIQHDTCEAGIAYKSVTPNPETLEGSALRIPCITKENMKYPLSEAQLADIANKGTCANYTDPTDEEVEADERESKERLAFVLSELAEGRTPDGVLVCGPGSNACKCNCPTSCEHVWDGPEVRDEDPDSEEAMGDEYVPSEVFTKTCSRCGKWAFSHDMMVGE